MLITATVPEIAIAARRRTRAMIVFLRIATEGSRGRERPEPTLRHRGVTLSARSDVARETRKDRGRTRRRVLADVM